MTPPQQDHSPFLSNRLDKVPLTAGKSSRWDTWFSTVLGCVCGCACSGAAGCRGCRAAAVSLAINCSVTTRPARRKLQCRGSQQQQLSGLEMCF